MTKVYIVFRAEGAWEPAEIVEVFSSEVEARKLLESLENKNPNVSAWVQAYPVLQSFQEVEDDWQSFQEVEDDW